MNLPLQSGYFDLVFSYGVLHHIPDMRKSILEVSRVTKLGGSVTYALSQRVLLLQNNVFKSGIY